MVKIKAENVVPSEPMMKSIKPKVQRSFTSTLCVVQPKEGDKHQQVIIQIRVDHFRKVSEIGNQLNQLGYIVNEIGDIGLSAVKECPEIVKMDMTRFEKNKIFLDTTQRELDAFLKIIGE
jgi:hypothetical protein